MNVRSIVSRANRLSVAAGLALVFPLAGLAHDRTSGATLEVTAFADRFVSAGVPFVDLDGLAALVQPANPTVLRLDGCGSESANALLVAAERFKGSHLEIRMLAATEPACATAASLGAVRVSQAGGGVPVRAAYVPSERYWRSVMP